MGYPYHELINPAVLLDNPGLARDQLQQKLHHVYGSPGWEFEPKDSWDSFSQNFNTSTDPLHQVLNLRESGRYKEFQTPTYDENGIMINPPWLNIRSKEECYVDGKMVRNPYEVRTHVRNDLGNPELVRKKLEEEVYEGYLLPEYHPWYSRIPDYFVDKIVSKKPTFRKGKWATKLTGYDYLLELREVDPIWETETFSTQEALWEKWPEFDPENQYDFSQKEGKFSVGFGWGNFLWQQRDGKYYLDEETFNRIPAGFLQPDRKGEMSFGYTDLILTAEAIKHEAWKLLSRRGLDHLGYFLRDFPDSRQRYEQAIWDSHMSLAARNSEMTHTEMMRLRLAPFIQEEPSRQEEC